MHRELRLRGEPAEPALARARRPRGHHQQGWRLARLVEGPDTRPGTRAKHTHLLQNSPQVVLLKVVLNRGRKIVTPLAESQRDMMAFVLV